MVAPHYGRARSAVPVMPACIHTTEIHVMSGWLQEETVRSMFQAKQLELRDYAERRDWSHRMPESVCLSHSIGLTFYAKGATHRVTYYLLPRGSEFRIDGNEPQELEVVHWTHWVSRIVLQMKDAVDRTGRAPSAVVYPIFGATEAHPVGPWVRYAYEDGQLAGFRLHAPGEAQSTAPADAGAPASAIARAGFGLREIVEQRDLDQDEVIRLPMHGAHVLTGGPGVGKTTVALHRISYLLNEQAAYARATGEMQAAGFFREDAMQVVVWKDHLVRYLESCLKELGHLGVKVRHAEDWVALTLRDYVRFGNDAGSYRKRWQEDWTESLKLGDRDGDASPWRGFTEGHVAAFLFGRDEQGVHHWSVARKLASDLAAMRSALAVDLEGLDGSDDIVRLVADAPPSPAALATLRTQVMARLEREIVRAKDIVEGARSFDPNRWRRQGEAAEAVRRLVAARERFQDAFRRLERAARFDCAQTLYEFYRSDFVRAQLVAGIDTAAAERFQRQQRDSAGDRMVSTADRYLLLWIVHLWTMDGRLGDLQPLPTWCHIVVDEAQYFPPVVLRLLADLCRAPMRSMTIVGDLQQKSRAGGLRSWSELRVGDEPLAVHRLRRAYRWSPEIFDFLSQFHRTVGLDDPLEQPPGGAVGDHPKPVVACHPSVAEEDRWLLDSIHRIRNAGSRTLVVCVADLRAQRWKDLVAALRSFDIAARIAFGEDVRECEEKVIVTDLDSVVGLEFGAVLLPGIEQTLGAQGSDIGPEAIRRAWVPMTRASDELLVSSVGSVAILGDDAFARWRR